MAPIVFTTVEFSEPPPDLDGLRARLEDRCGHEIVWQRTEFTEGEIRHAEAQRRQLPARPDVGELWLAELPEVKIKVSARERRESPPRADFFQELGWTVPSPAPPYWQVIVTGDSTLQQALADVLRECGGHISDGDGQRFSGPMDIAHRRRQLANARRWSWIGILSIPGIIIYLLLVAALMLIWLPLAFTRSRHRRWLRRSLWMSSGNIDVFKAADASQFAHYLLRRIGGSGGKIGTAKTPFGSTPRCRTRAPLWTSRQGVGPWMSAAAIVNGLCHTDRGSPWYIQFAEQPPEPLAAWLDRELAGP